MNSYTFDQAVDDFNRYTRNWLEFKEKQIDYYIQGEFRLSNSDMVFVGCHNHMQEDADTVAIFDADKNQISRTWHLSTYKDRMDCFIKLIQDSHKSSGLES